MIVNQIIFIYHVNGLARQFTNIWFTFVTKKYKVCFMLDVFLSKT